MDPEEEMDSHASAKLLPEGHSDGFYPVELQRWYILFVFSLFSFNQCLVWFTFSSVKDDKVISYYGPEHMNDSVIALLLNWGPIIGIAMFPLQVWITQRNLAGFQHAAILGATLVFLGTVVRTIPCFCSESFRQSGASIAFLHIGQILNAAGGPLCMGTESRLSCLWFRENERATATSIAVTSNACGTTVGFLLGPALVSAASDFPKLLYVEVVLAAIPFFCCVLHYPAKPADAPSAAAAAVVLAAANAENEDSEDSVKTLTFWEGLLVASKNRYFSHSGRPFLPNLRYL